MSTIGILGGGISGLSSAYYLSKLPKSVIRKIILLEGSNDVGGWIQTSKFNDGTLFEHGPRNMRASGKSAANTFRLVEELGLENEIIKVTRSHPASSNRFIYVHKQICTLPNGLMSLIKPLPPFSKPLALQCWKEPFLRGTPLHDESVYDFFIRRFAKELAEYVSDPLCRGIFAGDCRKLSVKSCFPEVFNLEQKYGSLIRGALLTPKGMLFPHLDKTVPTGLVKKAADEKWSLWTLQDGLSQFPKTMLEVLKRDERVDIFTSTRCDQVNFQGSKAKVSCGDKQHNIDHIISTVPAKSKTSELHGFGHLIPSIEPSKVLGVLYESCVFPEHNRNDGKAVRVTCMLGGSWFEEYFGDPDSCDLDLLGQVAKDAVREQLNIQTEPSRIIVNLQKDCIPQYHLGHCDIMDDLDSYINNKSLPLSLVGASYRGVSVNDCINNARLEVERLAQDSEKS